MATNEFGGQGNKKHKGCVETSERYIRALYVPPKVATSPPTNYTPHFYSVPTCHLLVIEFIILLVNFLIIVTILQALFEYSLQAALFEPTPSDSESDLQLQPYRAVNSSQER